MAKRKKKIKWEVKWGDTKMWAVVYSAVFILGYLVYGDIFLSLGLVMYAFVFNILSVIGCIPIIGQIIYYFVGLNWLQPSIFGLTGLYASDLVSVIFWGFFIVSVYISYKVYKSQ